jgi:hypothetical protein
MNRLSSALVAALLFAGSAQAQDWGSRPKERAQDRQEVRQDRREQRDDKRDLAELKAVLVDFDKARSRKNDRDMVAVEARLKTLLRAELAEGRVELASDQAETRRSGNEVRRADNRWEARDERKDRRDDRRDARVEAASQRTRYHIARELDAVIGSRRPADLNRERALIVELIDQAEKELRQNGQERQEDRRERREDRR